MKDMIFLGVITICNLILAYKEDGSVSPINLIACIGSLIYFVYLYYSKEKDNENK